MHSSPNYDLVWNNAWGDAQKYGPSHRIHRLILLRMIESLEFKSLLDVGCGNGANLAALRSIYPQVKMAGTDISTQALSEMTTLLPGTIGQRLDITRSSLDERFDLVLCFDVLEHLEQDMAALRNISLMTDKYLLLSTLQGRMREFEKQIGHVRNYAQGELESKVAAAGFRVIKKIEWGWPIYSPIYRNWLDRGGGQQYTHGRYGPLKRLACHLLYGLFRLAGFGRGDMIFILACKESK